VSSPQNRRNYYRILHVQPDAPDAVVKSSYRALMLSLDMHPDRGGEHWNAALINEAHGVLSNPAARAEYDLSLDPDRVGIGRPPGEATSRPVAAPGTRSASPESAAPESAAPESAAPESAAPESAGAESAVEASVGTAGGRPALARGVPWCCLFCGVDPTAGGAQATPTACPNCKSPLTPAGVPQHDAPGRRALRRVAREGDIAYWMDWPQAMPDHGRIVDLSPGGLRFVCSTPIEVFRILKMQGPLLDAVARVASCVEDDGSFAVGVHFYNVQFHQSRGTFLSTTA
jgi:hypothetical protein